MSGVMLATLLVLLALSVPVAVAVGWAGVAGILAFTHLPLMVVAQQLFIALDKYPLVAVPFFILAGILMEAGGVSARLVEFAKAVTGGVQGGLAVACVLTCMIFASISGSSVATTFAVGAILIPALVRHGYPVPQAAALQATAAELGVIIPPSIPMILYGISAEVPVGDLFLAGVGPGLLIGAALAAYVLLWCRRTGHGRQDGRDRLPLGRAVRRTWPALLMPVLVIGGIYGGVFTPTEASAVAVVYALGLGLLGFRTLRLRDLPGLFVRAAVTSSVILFIIAAAGLFNFLITRAGVPVELGRMVSEWFAEPALFLLAVNVFLFLVGMVAETSAAILVLAPILAPVAAGLGIDPVHFGIIMVVNLALGMVTPPFGVNLFAACAVARIGIDQVASSLVPYVLVVLGCLVVVTYVPALSLALPTLLR